MDSTLNQNADRLVEYLFEVNKHNVYPTPTNIGAQLFNKHVDNAASYANKVYKRARQLEHTILGKRVDIEKVTRQDGSVGYRLKAILRNPTKQRSSKMSDNQTTTKADEVRNWAAKDPEPMTRKEFVELFMHTFGGSKAGASTYYYNVYKPEFTKATAADTSETTIEAADDGAAEAAQVEAEEAES